MPTNGIKSSCKAGEEVQQKDLAHEAETRRKI